MQISTQVMTTTRIILNQKEIEDALIAYLRSKTEIPNNVKFDIDIGDNADKELEGEITIFGGSDIPFDSPFTEDTKPAAEPKRRGGKGTQAETRQTFTVPDEQEAVEDTDGKTTGETRQVELPATVAANEPKPDAPKVETEAKPAMITAKIFPDPATSAAYTPVPAEPSPEVKAKSLFANLVKPAN